MTSKAHMEPEFNLQAGTECLLMALDYSLLRAPLVACRLLQPCRLCNLYNQPSSANSPTEPFPHSEHRVKTSKYQKCHPSISANRHSYVPPRTNWGGPESPSRYDSLPAEMPSGESHVAGYREAAPARRRVNSGGSDIYYEDVDPRFAEDQPPLPVAEDQEKSRVPMLLTPGQQHQYRPEPLSLPPSHSYEDLPGARSPAESETSNFTSVSQRGVNPNWRPGNGGEFSSLGPMRRPPGARDQQQMRQDVLLQGNPDFALPGMTGPGRRARGGPASTRGGYPGIGGARIPPASAVPGVDGRYPMGGGPPGGPRGI